MKSHHDRANRLFGQRIWERLDDDLPTARSSAGHQRGHRPGCGFLFGDRRAMIKDANIKVEAN
jgi:hypothetical protein